MKKIFFNILKYLGILFATLVLVMFIFVLTPNSWNISQLASVAFPFVAGPAIIGLMILLLICSLKIWNTYKKKEKLSKELILLTSLTVLALAFGAVEWQAEKSVVEKNGGEVTLLGDSSIDMNAKPDEKVVYATKDNQDLTVSIYENANQSKSTLQPIYIYIHGGGWNTGDSESSAWLHRAMADKGYVAFSINYRLATDETPTWDTAIEDVADAIRWIKEHASEYGGDSNNILLSAESAGGHLALLYTGLVSSGQLDAPLPTAVGVMYPAIDLKWTSENGSYIVRAPGIVERFIGGNLVEQQERLESIDPMKYINNQFPPVFIIHGAKDSLVTITGSEKFVDQLNKNGGDAHLVRIPYANHGVNLQENVSLLANFANDIDGLKIKD